VVALQRGQIWWVDFGPALIVQSNAFNASRIQTVIVVPLTSNMRLGDAPGNVTVSKRRSKLDKDSVVNVSRVASIDRSRLLEYHGDLPADVLLRVDQGLHEVLAI
jgi:mRNA interferase MazF